MREFEKYLWQASDETRQLYEFGTALMTGFDIDFLRLTPDEKSRRIFLRAKVLPVPFDGKSDLGFETKVAVELYLCVPFLNGTHASFVSADPERVLPDETVEGQEPKSLVF
jgi:hypothetical protein